MTGTQLKYEDLKPIAEQVMRDVIALAQANRPVDWNAPYPQMGQHYYWQELNELPTYNSLCEKLFEVGSVRERMPRNEVDGMVQTLIEATLASSPGDPDLTYWWGKMCEMLESQELTIRTLFGLSNFQLDQAKYELDANTRIVSFGDKDLRDLANRYFQVWDWYGFAGRLSQAHAHNCKGAFLFDVQMPATIGNFAYGHYRGDCIHQMIRYARALRLAGFGRLEVEPWIMALNPEFPVDHLTVVGESRVFAQYSGPEYRLSAAVWERFKNAHGLLKRLDAAPHAPGEPYYRSANRFKHAVQRFDGTYAQGIWESAVVDLVIVLESLYLPTTKGGRLQVALAASNLLGTNEAETREIFENIQQAYWIRNAYVHGEPVDEKSWREFLHITARTAGVEILREDREIGWYALELLRDYARRSILALLNLHFDHQRHLDGNLEKLLLRLHLDAANRQKIQKEAQVFPLSDRPAYVVPSR